MRKAELTKTTVWGRFWPRFCDVYWQRSETWPLKVLGWVIYGISVVLLLGGVILFTGFSLMVLSAWGTFIYMGFVGVIIVLGVIAVISAIFRGIRTAFHWLLW